MCMSSKLNFLILSILLLGLTAAVVFTDPTVSYAAINWGKVLGVGDADDESVSSVPGEDTDEDAETNVENENNNNEAEGTDKVSEPKDKITENNDDNNSEDFDEIEKIIINSNGTKTVVKEEYDTEKTQVQINTYGNDGEKIDEKRYKSEGIKKEKPMLKTYGIDNNKLSELKYRTKSGEEVSLIVDGNDNKISRLYYDENKNQLILSVPEIDNIEVDNGSIDKEVENELSGNTDENIFDDDETKLVLRAHNDDEAFEMRHLGKSVYTKYQLKVNDDTGKLYLVAADKDIEISVFPDMVKEKIDKYYKVSADDVLELVSDDTNTKIIYKLETEKTERLLGLINVKIPVLLQYNINTNELSESTESIFAKVLDYISS